MTRQPRWIVVTIAVAAISFGIPGYGEVPTDTFTSNEATVQRPSIIVDNRPESGIPPEAVPRMHVAQAAGGEVPAIQPTPQSFRELTEGKLKTIRIRYFDKKTWETQQHVRDYLTSYLSNKSRRAIGQPQSEMIGPPKLECLIDFTDELQAKLLAEKKPCHEGRLLVWNTAACYRDPTGQWWFVDEPVTAEVSN